MPNIWSSRFRVPALLACLVVSCTYINNVPAALADSGMLEGGVSHWDRVEGAVDSNTASLNTGVLQSQTATSDLCAPVKPAWITGRVHTGPNAVMQTYFRITFGGFPTKIKRPWRPPNSGYHNLKLHSEIMQSWREGCWGDTYVDLVPFGPPGNFYFVHRSPDGHRGYMEYIGKGTNGYPNYRYWFQDDNVVQQSNSYQPSHVPNYGFQPGYGYSYAPTYSAQPNYGYQSGYGNQPNYRSSVNCPDEDSDDDMD